MNRQQIRLGLRLRLLVAFAMLPVALAAIVFQWWSVLLLTAGGLLLAIGAVWGQTWLHDRALAIVPSAAALWQAARMGPDDDITVIMPYQDATVTELARYLAGGTLTFVDLLGPGRIGGARARRPALHGHATDTVVDPRILRVEGRPDLLPLPNATLEVVMTTHLLGRLHPGDVDRLLREIRRILVPGGSLLLVEPVRLPTTLWLPNSFRLPRPAAVTQRLAQAGLHVAEPEPVNGVLALFRATASSGPGYRQLRFDF